MTHIISTTRAIKQGAMVSRTRKAIGHVISFFLMSPGQMQKNVECIPHSSPFGIFHRECS